MLLPSGRRFRTTSGESRVLASILFVVGLAIGGSATLAVLSVGAGLFSVITFPIQPIALTAVVFGLVVADLGLLPWRISKGRSKLIPQTRFSWSLSRGSLLFGIELGTGVLTAIPHVGPYILGVFVLLSGPDFRESLMLLAGWTAGRSIVLPAQLCIDVNNPRTGSAVGRAGLQFVLRRVGQIAGAGAALAAVIAIW